MRRGCGRFIPDGRQRKRTIARFDPLYPARGRELNAELCQLLVYLEAPDAARKTLELLAKAPTQEEQIEYAKSLRMLTTRDLKQRRRSGCTAQLCSGHTRAEART